MTTTSTLTAANLNTVLHGDCIDIMHQMHPGSVDFVITDPPYITRYADGSGRSFANDDNAKWLKPAFAQMHRLLKSAAFLEPRDEQALQTGSCPRHGSGWGYMTVAPAFPAENEYDWPRGTYIQSPTLSSMPL